MKQPSAFQNTAIYFDTAAEEYLNFLKKEHPEHFMESVAQATQRKITVASLDLVAAERPDVHVYSELLIQWRDKENEIRWVVPDNMVVVAEKKPKVSTNFAIPIQPARPFFVLEYVSNVNRRKDYQKSYDKYEAELRVPYYLMFYLDEQALSLFQYDKRQGKYISICPDDAERYAIRELDLEVGLLDGWTRYWWKGRLLPIATELQAELAEVRQENVTLRRELIGQTRKSGDKDRLIAEMQAELERLRKSAG